jgi:hypothetical protein
MNKILLYKILIFLTFIKINFCNISIVYISTIGKCGIAVCTKHIVDELNNLGHQASIIDSLKPAQEIINELKEINPEIINLQFSAGTMRMDILEVVDWAKQQKIKTAVVVHENFFWLPQLIEKVDKVILFNDQIMENNHKYVLIPMAVPSFDKLESRSNLRKKYSFKDNDIIISTFGFMIGWKQHDIIIEKLKPYMDKNQNIKLQFLTSMPGRIDLTKEKNKIKKAIEKSGQKKNIIHLTSFLTEQEVNERLTISDVGFLWGLNDYARKILGDKPNTTSASDKQFVSARLPLIAVDCPHYHDCNLGVIKTEENMNKFISTIISVSKNKKLLEKLKNEMEIKYQDNCIKNLIKKHIETFEEILNK